MTSITPNPDLEAIRARLRAARGQQFWRSLDELADTPAFRELVEREFPRGASEMNDPVSRRTFLKLMGASLALAGVAGCTYMPPEQIAPFDRQPLDRVPGVPRFFATTLTLNGYGTGVLVRSDEGRPTKVEGNPLHPASLGSTDLFAQAEILNLYDPDRSQTVLNRGAPSTWDEFVATLNTSLTAQEAARGAGIRLLTTTVSSPTLADQIAQFLQRFPQARWYQYEPINRDNVYEGARAAFGEYVSTRYDLSKAQVILALDADFLAPGPGFIPYARAFADGRRVTKASKEMNRLYVVEATPSTTGAAADHRLALKASNVGVFAFALAEKLGLGGAGAGLSEEALAFLKVAAEDLEAHRGACVVIPGDQQPPIVHELAHRINAALGNVGSTVIYTEPVEARPTNQTDEIAGLVNEINAGQVELLVMLGGNPAYNAPGDLRFAEALQRVSLSVHHSLFVDETSALSTWHIPAAHQLESWSDARAYDGAASIVQPLIEPLYGGKTEHEVLAALLGQPDARPYDLVRAFWQKSNLVNGNFEAFWQSALASGVISGSAAPTVTPTLQPAAGGAVTAPAAEELEIVFRPDPSVWDGAYTNNGWMMELPRPLTKLVWDNAVLMSIGTASRLLGLGFNVDDLKNPDSDQRQIALERMTAANGTMVSIRYAGGALELPLWLTPGHAENSMTVFLGYGRRNAGRVGNGVGVDVYPVRTSAAPWFGTGVEVRNANRKYLLVSTQDHWTLEGRDIVRVGVFEEFKQNPKYIAEEVYMEEYGKKTPGPGTDGYISLQPGVDYSGRNAWGMTINLNACIGCNACVVACQAENNIPIVGKDQVSRGREMHWIRIDRYYAGDNLDNPDTYMMPMACVQCEQAPCEVVCPVIATVHDYEGLNNMVYNRCVGTKYCSNNCPYKVRRFNFLQYADLNTPSLQLARNPEVTVRNRGVMEKCTYCIQRISAARIAAKKAAVQNGQSSYTIEDGAIVVACEGACPTQAIVFGDINDPASRVAKWKAEPHNYGVLNLLNIFPRTTYLARIRNPNEELEAHGEG
ncbi:MAG: TAT-variant-translocated molybdopterin oxidoreductase [Oscillochloridaceae bacterium]|nr:TAT-variant-translocated molybdopterin oxidoreductase [Chloroflexaceae bacterium]MDW8390303.1 TAT-variant-translocated molybdopterin oxidoreductase [Oscillochloridaceae bacterium]